VSGVGRSGEATQGGKHSSQFHGRRILAAESEIELPEMPEEFLVRGVRPALRLEGLKARAQTVLRLLDGRASSE